MSIYASSEKYLMGILRLQSCGTSVSQKALAQYLGFSENAVNHMITILQSGGFLTTAPEGSVYLSSFGRTAAEQALGRAGSGQAE